MEVKYIPIRNPRRLPEPVELTIERRWGGKVLATYFVDLSNQHDLALLSLLLQNIKYEDYEMELKLGANATSRAVYNAIKLGCLPLTLHLYICRYGQGNIDKGVAWIKFDREGNIIRKKIIVSSRQLIKYAEDNVYPRKLPRSLQSRLDLLL